MKSVTDQLSPNQRSAILRAEREVYLQPLLFSKAKGLKWLKSFVSAGFLAPNSFPRPIQTDDSGYVNLPVWPITNYLIEIRDELKLIENLESALQVLTFIRDASKYAAEQEVSNYRVWWQFAKIIVELPIELIEFNDIEMVDRWLSDPYDRGLVAEVLGEKWAVYLLEQPTERSKELAYELIKRLYEVKFVDSEETFRGRKKAVLKIDTWHAEKLSNVLAAFAGGVLGKKIVWFFQATVEQTLAELQNDSWSTIWRPAIEEHEQNTRDDVENVLLNALRDSLLGFCKNNPATALPYMEALLGSNFKTIVRTAIYVANIEYENLRDLSNQVTSPDFFNSNYRHELWRFLNTRYEQLPYKTKESVVKTIELTGKREGESNSMTVAYQTAIWLSAIKDFSAPLTNQYRGLVDEIGSEPENPDFASFLTFGWEAARSAFTAEDLQTLTISELVFQLNSFQEHGGYGTPTIRGLSKSFRQAVKGTPIIYYENLSYLSELNTPYLYELIEAFNDLWTEKALLPWDSVWRELFNFFKIILEDENFWIAPNNNDTNTFIATKDWVVGAIARLIENGCKFDSHAFTSEENINAENIILIMLKRQPGEKFELSADAVSLAINSPRGRCLEALINLSLRNCRLSQAHNKQHKTIWQHYEKIFESELTRIQKGDFEFATLVAIYIPNFIYMSHDWVLNSLDKIFNEKNYQAWLCAIQGYSYVNNFYPEIYKYLRNSGQLIKALDDEHIAKNVEKVVIHGSVIAYFTDLESIDDESSVLSVLLTRSKFSELSQIAWFVWTMRSERMGAIKDFEVKILFLWKKILEQIDTKKSEGQKIASHLCDWISFVDTVDESNRSLISAVLPYSNVDHRSYEVLKNIARISKKQPMEACEMWASFLQNSATDYPDEAVQEALRNILKVGPDGKRAAKGISDKYLRYGNVNPSLLLNTLLTEIEAGKGHSTH